MIKSKAWSTLLCLAVLSLVGMCSTQQVAGGSGTDAPNSLTIAARNGMLTGHSGFSGTLSIFDTGYTAFSRSGFSHMIPLERNVDFSAEIPPGTYNIVVRETGRARSVLIAQYRVDQDQETRSETLSDDGSIGGRIVDEAGIPRREIVVALKGTDLLTESGIDGMFRLEKVPQGTHTLLTKPVSSIKTPGQMVQGRISVEVIERGVAEAGDIPLRGQ